MEELQRESAPSQAVPLIPSRGRFPWIDWQVVASIISIKLILLIFGVVAYQVLLNQRVSSLVGAFEIWNVWDAPHYIDIAQHGYVSSGPSRFYLVFYPLFPALTHVFALVLVNYVVAAFAVSALASVAAGLLLYHLVRLDSSDSLARGAVWFLFIFPTSYFLHIGYTESLFLALTLGSFLAARKQNWMAAGLVGALASFTRVNGLFLIPALAVEAYLQYRQSRRWDPEWLWIGCVFLGFAAYLWINYRVTGNPLAFEQMLKGYWYKSFAWPWQGIQGTIQSIGWRGPADGMMVGIMEAFFILLTLVATVVTFFTIRPSYGVWMAGNWLIITSTGFILSVPRYALIFFPIYILFARLGRERIWYSILTTASLLFLGLFTGLFVEGHWAF